LHERLRTVGLTTLDHPADVYGLGLTLGNCEARLLELTNAYASLARLGEYRPWRVLADAPTNATRYSRPELVWQIADILSDNSARTLAFGINSALRFDFPVACKTGTSTDFRDNWTIGFTPEFTVGVWVGNFDGSPMHEVSGVTGAGPILHGIFEHLHAQRGTTWYVRPAAIVERSIHPLTGRLLGDDDPRAVREKFIAESLPPNESAEDYEDGRVKLPNEYSGWFASAENSLRDVATISGSELRIVTPVAGSTYLLDPDVSSSRRIPLRAEGGRKLHWSSESLALENGEFALANEGEHRISVIDEETGQRAEVRIAIKSL
jgi:penicillin-binding protein 1C